VVTATDDYRIEEMLEAGEQVTLSDAAVAALTLRRLQQIKHGPWEAALFVGVSQLEDDSL
jgi:hypothetical protein